MNDLIDPFLISAQNFDGPVLVTGAAGCIGAWTVSILTESGIPCIAGDIGKDRNRVELLVGSKAASRVDWQSLDVTNGSSLSELIAVREICAIIHLAGLQVPFCAADPALGARVNVEGTVNVLQAARVADIKRVAYASSVAAHAFPIGSGLVETLYGAYKTANEQTASVYWNDWKVPSIGLRPNVVFGVGRDQGMSSVSTRAIHAAALGKSFQIPYTGPYSWLYAGEAAAAFIAAVSQPGHEAAVYDLNGRCCTLELAAQTINLLANGDSISTAGPAFPFPANLCEKPIHSSLPKYHLVSVEDGIRTTFAAFQRLKAENRLPDLSD